jgi:uncharacterized membrane protein
MTNFHVIAGHDATPDHFTIRRIGIADLKECLRRGIEDFAAMPSHLAFLGLLYPILGVIIAAFSFSNNALPLIFPLASGFALVGPFAAIGLYEISRRRELGLEAEWHHAFDVLRSPAIPSIIAMGLILMTIFVLWLGAAQALYESLFGTLPPESYTGFLTEVVTTGHGWALIILGNLIGLVFAIVALSVSVVSFPLLLDRDVGVAVAVATSIRAVVANPRPLAAWGIIVAASLVVGSIPLFVGLAIVMPILGHATWHLYRRLVEPDRPDEARAARAAA